MKESTRLTKSDLIPFEAHVGFEELKRSILSSPVSHQNGLPLPTRWLWMAPYTLPVGDPLAIKHDPRNPVLLPSKEGFDDFTIKYPFLFWNPADRRFYAYYLGRQQSPPKQT